MIKQQWYLLAKRALRVTCETGYGQPEHRAVQYDFCVFKPFNDSPLRAEVPEAGNRTKLQSSRERASDAAMRADQIQVPQQKFRREVG